MVSLRPSRYTPVAAPLPVPASNPGSRYPQMAATPPAHPDSRCACGARSVRSSRVLPTPRSIAVSVQHTHTQTSPSAPHSYSPLGSAPTVRKRASPLSPRYQSVSQSRGLSILSCLWSAVLSSAARHPLLPFVNSYRWSQPSRLPGHGWGRELLQEAAGGTPLQWRISYVILQNASRGQLGVVRAAPGTPQTYPETRSEFRLPKICHSGICHCEICHSDRRDGGFRRPGAEVRFSIARLLCDESLFSFAVQA